MSPTILTRAAVTPTRVAADVRRVLDLDAAVVALPVVPSDGDDVPRVGAGGDEVAAALHLDLTDVLAREDVSGKPGTIATVPVVSHGDSGSEGTGVTSVHLIGVGSATADDLRRAGAALGRAVRGRERVATTIASTADEAALRAFVEGVVLSTFAMGAYKGAGLDDDALPAATVALAGEEREDTVAAANTVAAAAWLARELVHTPSQDKDPAWLAERASTIAGTHGLEARIRDEDDLLREGFGGLVAVGSGSDRPPRLIALRYEPARATADTPHVVLVGKGITYDTGGLSLKPREAMVPMKTDMSGGAVVLGVLSALRDLAIDVQVTGLVAAAENMPGAAAQRPGDVITQFGGTTVEIRNTDAEGRLVLADAIAYAVAELDPSVVVDVATLTGAATVGLGRTHAALYATDETLRTGLVDAGSAAGERLWPMPLVDDYRSALDSEIADVAHVTTKNVGAGSITAALFLERFVGGVPWAHLDIAGPGRADGDKAEVVKGGTAFGTRALLYWLERYGTGIGHK